MTQVAAILPLYLPWAQVGLSVLLSAMILLQRSEAGLGAAFGDSGGSITHTRRGAEKFLFRATIAVAVLFVLASGIGLAFV